jgi:flagellar motor switch protein FliG
MSDIGSDFNIEQQKIEEYHRIVKGYNGIEKAAMLMIALGKDASASIMQRLSDDEVEDISSKIATTSAVEPGVTEAVFLEFYELIKAQQYIAMGGIDYAREVLEDAVGDVRAMEIIKKIQRLLQVRGFNVLKQVDSTQLLTFIQKEHPQTIALVLTQLDPAQAANVISELPEELRNDVIMRFASMERVSQDMIETVEKVLEDRIDFTQQGTKFGGVAAAAEILNMVGSSTERTILDAVAAKDPKLATEIKNLMFVFEDMIYLDDRVIQKVLRDIDQKDLAMALKGANDEVRDKIFNNMSERAASIIQEEMEYAGPVRLRDVENARQNILDVIRKLEELGEIQLVKGGESFIE